MDTTKTTKEHYRLLGTGLFYEYQDQSKLLKITNTSNKQCMFQTHIALSPRQTVKDFIHILERTTQVQALMASAHLTHNIVEVFELNRLHGFLRNALNDASTALYFELHNFKACEEYFCTRYKFKSFLIEKMAPLSNGHPYFKIKLETQKGNTLEFDAESVYECLLNISRLIISDLIFRETHNNFEQTAQRLLCASSKLSMLSLILNKRFDPASQSMNSAKMIKKSA